MTIRALGYLGVESPNHKEWETFGPEVLGLQVSDITNDGSVLLRVDDRAHRIAVHPGERDRMSYAGWEVGSAAELDEDVARLEAAGIRVRRAVDEELAARGVTGMATFTDPLGLTHELFYGQLSHPRTFQPGRPIKGFVTGEQGLGHAVFVVPDLDKAAPFYEDAMGFRLSDTIHMDGFADFRFYHCNPRHHSMAILGIPGVKGLQHLMLQLVDLDDVGTALDICQERDIQITLTFGRHTNDRMVSFYLRSPGGFEIEYGWGGLEVDDTTWTVGSYTAPSIWGHKFVATTTGTSLEEA